jgi:hypothetical protein
MVGSLAGIRTSSLNAIMLALVRGIFSVHVEEMPGEA